MKYEDPNTETLCGSCAAGQPMRQDRRGTMIVLHGCGANCDCLGCFEQRSREGSRENGRKP